MNTLHSWFFHFNQYTGLWAAVPLNAQQDYWTKMYPHEGSKALFNADLNTVMELASKFQPVQTKTVYEQYGLFDAKNA